VREQKIKRRNGDEERHSSQLHTNRQIFRNVKNMRLNLEKLRSMPGVVKVALDLAPYTLHPTPYTLHSTSYILHPTLYTLHPTPYTLHPKPYTPHPAPYTLHPTPYTLYPTPYILHPAFYTLNPSSCTKHPTDGTLHTTPCKRHPTPLNPDSQLPTPNPQPPTPNPQTPNPQTQTPKPQTPNLKPHSPNSQPQVEPLGTWKGHLTIDNAYIPPASLPAPGGGAQPESSASNLGVLVIALIWYLGYGGWTLGFGGFALRDCRANKLLSHPYREYPWRPRERWLTLGPFSTIHSGVQWPDPRLDLRHRFSEIVSPIEGYLKKGIQSPMAHGRFIEINSMIKWIVIIRFSIMNFFSLNPSPEQRLDPHRGSHHRRVRPLAPPAVRPLLSTSSPSPEPGTGNRDPRNPKPRSAKHGTRNTNCETRNTKQETSKHETRDQKPDIQMLKP